MKVNNSELISFIITQSEWVDATYLASFFNVTTRTIRARINQINKQTSGLIESSHKGYRVNREIYENTSFVKENSNTSNSRIQYIIRKLIATNTEISIYDLADQLYISDSQFERSLTEVKTFLQKFGLTIVRKRNKIKISGEEIDKRKLINFLVSQENKHGFILSDNIESLSYEINLDVLKDNLLRIFEEYDIFINDYGFHTILIHIIVMIDRIRKGNYILNQNQTHFELSSIETSVTLKIVEYIEKEYNIEFSNHELYYLSLIVSNNSNNINTSIVNENNIEEYIEKEYIALTTNILSQLTDNYCLDGFSPDFTVNLTIHIRNLLTRARNKIYTRNPLTDKFKNQYPLIYDMAAFIAKEINDYEAIRMIDDEIAFIAFHIGAYLENNNMIKTKINCCFVYADYRNLHVRSIEKITEQLHSTLYISSMISTNNIKSIPKHTDLVISCSNQPLTILYPVVECSMFISDADITNIRTEAEKIKKLKKKAAIKEDLDQFTNQALFKKNFYFEHYYEYIDVLTRECIEMNLCDESFYQEVMEREKLSCTSFKNGVAVPHSLNANARQSFLYVILNQKPIQWNENPVYIIMMIGTAKKDRNAFKSIFDGVIEVLYEPTNVRQLAQCENYTEFIEKLTDLIYQE